MKGPNEIKYYFLVIGSLNILLHGLGTYLLIAWYKTERKTPQRLLLINLAICEMSFNLVALVKDLVKVFDFHFGFIIVNAVTIIGFNWMVILAMFYITGDRLLAVLLNIRYQYFCSNDKTMKLIIVTGVIGVITSITVGVLEYFRKIYMKPIIVYVNPIISIIYFVFALVTYLILFIKYLQSIRKMRRLPTDNIRISPWKAFVGSRFFIPMLLIGSYMLLTVIPSLVRSILTWDMSDKNDKNVAQTSVLDVNIAYEVLSRLSHTVDDIIYIYLSKPVRDILLTRLRFCRSGIHDKGNGNNMAINDVYKLTDRHAGPPSGT